VALNLAIALAKCGGRVGIIDADIWSQRADHARQTRLRPTDRSRAGGKFRLQVISMGTHGRRCADVWRGPMHTARCSSSSAIGGRSVDYLIIDLRRGRQHRAQSGSDRAGRRLDRRDDAAVCCDTRARSRCAEAEHPAARHRREQAILCAATAYEANIFGHGGSDNWRPISASRFSGASRSTSRFAKAAALGVRSRSANRSHRQGGVHGSRGTDRRAGRSRANRPTIQLAEVK
jgi:hypothetical protein